MLQDIKKSLVDCAKCLGDYESISKTDLANGYCDADEAGDEDKRNQYYAALMLRYWYKIYEYQKTCASLRLPIEDYVDWLHESFQWAFRYRRWRDPQNELYNDPNGPDKVFNRCFFSTRGRHYQHSNKDLRKINYTSYSLDASTEEVGDHNSILAEEDNLNTERDVVDIFVKKNKMMEALVLDGILYQNVFEDEKKICEFDSYNAETDEYETVECTRYDTNFNIKKLVKHLKNLDENFVDYFTSFYQLNEEEATELKNKIASIKPSSIKKIVERTLYNLSQSGEILSFLGRGN